jgi:hypothetical protein
MQGQKMVAIAFPSAAISYVDDRMITPFARDNTRSAWYSKQMDIQLELN